jgi:phosphoglycerol transferase
MQFRSSWSSQFMEDSSMGTKGVSDRCLLIGIAIVFLAITVRNTGLYPSVMGDEYFYNTYSRLRPSSESQFPSYLYLAIYGVTSVCGDGFLECARILNSLFFVGATPFLYLTARRVCAKAPAVAVTLLTLAGPINTHTAYFMPESLYFLSFWLLTWFILRLHDSATATAWSLAGLILGLASLVKPHALFLLPAIVVYMFYADGRREGRWLRRALINASAFVAIALLAKLVVGYWLAGKAGITLFGSCYTTIANSTASQPSLYGHRVVVSIASLTGHVMAICLMFGAPLAIAVHTVFDSTSSKSDTRSEHRIAFYAIAVLFCLVLVTGVFTASNVPAGREEVTARLHVRYYSFAFPLLLMIAASGWSSQSTAGPRRWRFLAALPIGAVMVCAVVSRFASYTPVFVDCPELRGFTYDRTVFYILGGMSLLTLGLWVHSAQIGRKVFVCVFVPLAVVCSDFYINRDLGRHRVPEVYCRAGIWAQQCLSEDELSKLLVVGSDRSGLLKTLFAVDNPGVSRQALPAGGVCDLAALPEDKEWVLVVGDHALSHKASFELSMNGFTLARVRGSQGGQGTPRLTLDKR